MSKVNKSFVNMCIEQLYFQRDNLEKSGIKNRVIRCLIDWLIRLYKDTL